MLVSDHSHCRQLHLLGEGPRAQVEKAHLPPNCRGPEMRLITGAQSHWQEQWPLNTKGGLGDESPVEQPRPHNNPMLWEAGCGFGWAAGRLPVLHPEAPAPELHGDLVLR